MSETNLRDTPGAHALLRQTRTSGWLTAVFFLVLGAIFLIWGLADDNQFTTFMGAAFVLYGALNVARVFKTPKFQSGDEQTTLKDENAE